MGRATPPEIAERRAGSRVNWLLMAGVVLLVFGFRSSGNLAAAYGISVTGAMTIDDVLAGLVATWRWG